MVLKTNGVVTEGMFPWNQARYIGSMSHAQSHRDEHSDYVYTERLAWNILVGAREKPMGSATILFNVF